MSAQLLLLSTLRHPSFKERILIAIPPGHHPLILKFPVQISQGLFVFGGWIKRQLIGGVARKLLSAELRIQRFFKR